MPARGSTRRCWRSRAVNTEAALAQLEAVLAAEPQNVRALYYHALAVREDRERCVTLMKQVQASADPNFAPRATSYLEQTRLQ